MTFALILFLLFNFAKANVNQTNITCKTLFRVVGGRTAMSREEFPYQVSIRVYNRHICGGSIITSLHILSAAHCFSLNGSLINNESDLRLFTVVVGDLNVYKRSAHTVVRNVVSIRYHHSVRYPQIKNDIAVIKLNKNFTEWNPFIRKIELTKTLPKPGKLCVVSGWGRLKEGGPVPSELQMLRLPILSKTTCTKAYGFRIKRGMFCAGYMEGGRSICSGDSGGPLVCDGLLCGIVSASMGCARAGKPGLYVNVGAYRNWIIKVAGNTSTIPLHSKIIYCVFLFHVLVYYYLQ